MKFAFTDQKLFNFCHFNHKHANYRKKCNTTVLFDFYIIKKISTNTYFYNQIVYSLTSSYDEAKTVELAPSAFESIN